MKYRLAFIGFGVVGQGLAEILVESKQELREKYGFEFDVVAISDKLKGSVYNPEGLELQSLLKLVRETGKLEGYENASHVGWDSLKTITDTNANVIVEVSWTDLQTGEPALTHVRTALQNGKHVVLTNKGPVALAIPELEELATQNNAQIRYEGTVLSGTPAINLGLKNLAGAKIQKIWGIVNGTTNYILTEMEKGLSYETALKNAQELGYAEADPTGDVEGWDAVGKVVILTNVLMGGSITKADVEREGITHLTPAHIEEAKKEGKKWKLIASSELLNDGRVKASVKPMKIDATHPLASVSGPTNALTFTTKYLGEVTIIGPGAGKLPTGYALLSDLLDIHRTINKE